MALQSRPPVITIMGHVDHGKTTLLDYLRKTQVVAGEAGGITQHIGAYTINHQGKSLTFIDTPGHAAFTKMRERGAKVTDLVILVVAIDDGVKPQTIESIRLISQAKVPMVVAITKCDLPNTYPEVIKGELAQHGVMVVGFGGEIEAVPVSSKTGEGIESLLDTLSVLAELHNFQADATAPLKAVVIESSKDDKRGSLATVIVQQGTLKLRQDLVTQSAQGRVRALVDAFGKNLTEVTPGLPAEIVGFKEVPRVGEIVWDQAFPLNLSEENAGDSVPTQLSFGTIDMSNPNISDLLEEREKLKLIIRSDVTGTLEAITQALDPDSVMVLNAGVGPVTEQDLDFAQTAGAVIIAFHVKVSGRIRQMAKEIGVRIKAYDVIYHLLEDLEKQMLKLLEPTIDEVVIGEAEILQIFEMRGERIAGVRVKTGQIKKSDWLHLKRNDEIIANPVIKSMMHGKEEIALVNTKNEAGLTFKNRKLDFQVGDILVAYKKEVDVD